MKVDHVINIMTWAVCTQIVQLIDESTPFKRCIASVALEGNDLTIFIDVIDTVLENNIALASSLNAVGRTLTRQIEQIYKTLNNLNHCKDLENKSLLQAKERVVGILKRNLEPSSYLWDIPIVPDECITYESA
jgi:hypothetical protein